MITISSPNEMQVFALNWRAQGKKIAFVPTMGALHEGHLSLMREGRKSADILVVSIFVNPLQFGPKEDLTQYPRPIEEDLKKCESCGVDVVFFPTVENMYPKGSQTFVGVAEITKALCGTSRPTHFKGVTTVVLKLFNIVQPHTAIFGEKDYQQLATIKRMVADLNLSLEIIGMPIMREADSLAMSSRNVYLSPEERIAALSIPRSLKLAQAMIKEGVVDVASLTMAVKGIIEENKIMRVDYVKICNAEDLIEQSKIVSPSRLFIAAFAGSTRLIDNCQLI